jgi:signal peptidase I
MTVKEVAGTSVIAVVCALLLKFFVLGAFYIPSHSMEPTLVEGDYILVNKLRFAFGTVQRNTVVVFTVPDSMDAVGSGTFVKRVTAVEGDTAMSHTGQMVIVPKDHVFVCGDNSQNSWDSRYWGCLPVSAIQGSPLCTYWSYGVDTTSTEKNIPGIRWDRIAMWIH